MNPAVQVPEKPGGNPCRIKVRHLIVNVDELLVLVDDGVLRVRVVVDCRVSSDLQYQTFRFLQYPRSKSNL